MTTNNKERRVSFGFDNNIFLNNLQLDIGNLKEIVI